MKSLRINEAQKLCHRISKSKGWHDEPVPFPQFIALVHSELSEALEAYREKPKNEHCGIITIEKDGEPTGVAIELADVVIRILDYCEDQDIDLESTIRCKCTYNKTRPYRHGNKVI